MFAFANPNLAPRLAGASLEIFSLSDLTFAMVI